MCSCQQANEVAMILEEAAMIKRELMREFNGGKDGSAERLNRQAD